jgi:hypothetical protein
LSAYAIFQRRRPQRGFVSLSRFAPTYRDAYGVPP